MSMHVNQCLELRKAGATRVIRYGTPWEEADDFVASAMKLLKRDRPRDMEEAIHIHPYDDLCIWEGNAKIVKEIRGQALAAAP